MTSPPSLALEGGGLRIVFTRQADRYAHAVFCPAAVFLATGCAVPSAEPPLPLEVQPLLESIEGTPDDDWPASPALKELHFEDRGDGRRLALLVGMAGQSHWSLSVELDAAAGRVTFDVACRLRGVSAGGLRGVSAGGLRGSPARLGSRYLLAPTLAQGGVAELPLAIEPIGGESARLVVPADGQIVIEPPSVAGPCPRTVRWRYVVRA